jgi:hypothetical protein
MSASRYGAGTEMGPENTTATATVFGTHLRPRPLLGGCSGPAPSHIGWRLVDADVSQYFDTIPHAELMKSLASAILICQAMT